MRRTRVVATVGPASWDSDNLKSIFDAGADVFRLNYSHGELEQKTVTAGFIEKKLYREK